MRKLATTAIAGALASVLLLTGCTPEPTPTTKPTSSSTNSSKPTEPTDKPETVAAPKSADEALEAAKDAVDTYLAVRAEIESEHPADASEIDTVATGDAAEYVRKSAAAILENGSLEGTYLFEPWNGWGAATDRKLDDETIKYGQVSLTGCFDSSKITGYDKDGNKIEGSTIRRGVNVITVVYAPSAETWLVAINKSRGKEIEEC